jgi:ribonuclease P protein component
MVEFEKNTRKRFQKSERLSSHRHIQSLFSQGKSFNIPPFVVKYLNLNDQELGNHQVLISVSKRNFKRAVDRNRIKRQIREAYRLNKHIIADLPDKYAIAYIYTFKEKIQSKNLEDKLIECLSRLKNELDNK